MGGDTERPMSVEIDLTDDRMRVTAGDIEVADWGRDEVRIQALQDGFHVRAEGEEVVLDIREDARFALEIGLRSAHPLLRRKMSALLRDDA
jgi:HSP20 family molecular chaperone IbpA